ncbi:alpha/beta hydrolase [Caulobacter endophyticus]|uniref:alpha/beta hydrolase n=1 Tax=Caulobacter endophyticus TaxID=2172652 RepID=UPI00240FAAD9|nr:alpha/beta hydrolase [Caulobacter endophyticus]MDG2527167.1 alpha/beta hydrolase [Caulobacter endophyticus]
MSSNWNRRRLLAASGAMAVAGATSVRAEAEPETLELWPGGAPGGERVGVEERRVAYNWPDGRVDYSIEGVRRPTLALYPPAKGRRPKAAVLVAPGGGFSKVVIGKEGDEIARWLAANGVLAGVLLYRLPRDGWAAGADAPLQDAQRALRLLRSRAGGARTGALGFSAGGTIAAALASRGGGALYPIVDELDTRPTLPDFVGLGYPWLTHPQAPPRATPFHGFNGPTKAFLFHAEDDPKVDVRNSREAATAIIAAGGKAELKIFPTGGHGFALRSRPPAPEAAWSEDFLRWLDQLDG